MIPPECNRLAEVSKHTVQEKSILHRHPSTLHLRWARRPLASSRAVLQALLLPDPSDAHTSEEFNQQARKILWLVQEPLTNSFWLRKKPLSQIRSTAPGPTPD